MQPGKNYLIACNHMGYMDIAVIQSVFKNNFFITHNEITEKYKWLSFLPKMAGTYFIERRNTKTLRREIRDTVDILKTGSHLVLFPEGTSADGSRVLPFHAPFFLTAVRAQKEVLPICINYTSINNEPINVKNKHFLCWTTKNISFLNHFCNMLRNIYSVSVSLTISPTLNSQDKTSRELAEESERCIKQNFKVIV